MGGTVRISEGRASPATAKSVQLSCPKCGLLCEAVFPYGASEQEKIQVRHDVITDHARVCTVATGEVERIWMMEYPRV